MLVFGSVYRRECAHLHACSRTHVFVLCLFTMVLKSKKTLDCVNHLLTVPGDSSEGSRHPDYMCWVECHEQPWGGLYVRVSVCVCRSGMGQERGAWVRVHQVV